MPLTQNSAAGTAASRGTTRHNLGGRRLFVARALWVGVVLLTALIFAASVPAHLRDLHTACATIGGSFGFLLIPISIGAAILRYRLYDVDVVINRTLVYGSLSVTLALLIYFGGVATIQALLRTLTGQERHPQLAIVVSTLTIAALFGPLRRSIQNVIDRRFYRRKYDRARKMAAFGARLREDVELQTLSDGLLGVLQETVQPANANLWLRSLDGKSEAKEWDL